MKRIHVVGTSGSGKTTFATKLAARLSAPHIELDALFWKENWEARSDEELSALVYKGIKHQGSWVLDGNYMGKLDDEIRKQTDTVIYLQTPLLVCMARVARRGFFRVKNKEQLWGNNQETYQGTLKLLRLMPGWHRKLKRAMRNFSDEAQENGIKLLSFRSSRQAIRWLSDL